MVVSLVMNTAFLSLPVRGAWIEIRRAPHDVRQRAVAPRAGSVD